MKMLAILVLLCAVCGANAEQLTIGIALPDSGSNSFTLVNNAFWDEAKKLGFLATTSFAKDGVSDLIKQKIAAVVVWSANDKDANLAVNAAHAAKIPIVVLYRMPGRTLPDFVVQPNFYEVGVQQANGAVAATGGRGNYVIISGAYGNWEAKEINRGIDSVLQKYPNIHVVLRKYVEAPTPQAVNEIVSEALAKNLNQIQAILVGHGKMVLGATDAINKQGITGKVFVSGIGADKEVLKGIIKRNIQLTIYMDYGEMGRFAAQAALRLAKHEKPKPTYIVQHRSFRVPTLLSGVMGINSANYEQKLFKLQVVRREDLEK